MSLQVNRLTNANIYVDGASFLGRAEEITLPYLKTNMSDFKALGMKGVLELPAGMDKMEATIKWNAFYEDVLVKFADPNKAVNLQVRGNLEIFQGGQRVEEKAVVVYLTATSKTTPGGAFKQNDNVELSSNLNVTSFKLVIGGREIVEFDALNNIHKVDGVDLLKTYRKNLGI